MVAILLGTNQCSMSLFTDKSVSLSLITFAFFLGKTVCPTPIYSLAELINAHADLEFQNKRNIKLCTSDHYNKSMVMWSDIDLYFNIRLHQNMQSYCQ